MTTGVDQIAQPARPVTGAGMSRHRWRILLAALCAAALLAFLAFYGIDYYRLEAADRLTSAKHAQLRPSGLLGHPLGILGGVLFLLIFLYPIRKRWRWLAGKGRTKHWLDFHILMGLTAPIIITFHSSFKLQGVAGLAYWIMMSVVLSGIVGRYFYGQIPRRLDAAEMSLQDMQALSEQYSARLATQHVFSAGEIAPLFRLPSLEQVQSLPLLRAIGWMLLFDVKRLLLLARLRRKAASAGADAGEFSEIVSVVTRQAALSKKILFLSKTQQIFHLWHVVHRPFSYSFAILSSLHVLIVLLLGYI